MRTERDPDLDTADGDGPGRPRPRARARRPRWKRVLIWVGSVTTVLLIVAGAAAGWALNRYVIDHVEISDVAAYEAEVTGTTDATTAADPSAVVTADSYASGDTTITIEQVTTGSGDDTVTYYVADVVLGDATELRSAFAENKFGTNIVADTSDIAADAGAILAVNGDYYGYRDSGIVIRNGVVYRDDGAREGLAIYTDGHMELYDETATTAEELVAAGVWNTISFGPGLLEDGEVIEGIDDVEVDTNFGNHSIQGNQPRTAVGMVDEDHFVFVVVDGRSEGYSRGVTMTELAEIMEDLGCTVAYNLDGGGSSTMWFDGELVNDPLGKGAERETSDIFYIASALTEEVSS